MRNLSNVLFLGIFSSFLCNPVKGEFDYNSFESSNADGIEDHKCVSSNGACIKKGTYTTGDSGFNADNNYVDKENNLIIQGTSEGGLLKWIKYDAKDEAFTAVEDSKDNKLLKAKNFYQD